MSAKIYSLVYFRINLSFKNILIHSIVTSAGYFFGIGVFIFSHNWILIFLVAEIFSLVYLYPSISKFKNELKINNKLFSISKEYLFYMFSNIVNILSMYFDRYILIFLINAQAISYLFVATLLGKILATITVPISGVLLSYFSSYKFKDLNNFFNKMVVSVFTCMFIMYISLMLLTPLIMPLLYHKVYKSVEDIINIGNLSAILFLGGNFLNTFTLKFVRMESQLLIQYSYLLIYIILSVLFIFSMGLTGFIYATIIANLYRILVIILITKIKINMY